MAVALTRMGFTSNNSFVLARDTYRNLEVSSPIPALGCAPPKPAIRGRKALNEGGREDAFDGSTPFNLQIPTHGH